MKNRLVIVGAGGHGKVIADIAFKNGYKNIVFADDRASGECLGFKVIADTSRLNSLDDGDTDFVIAIGNNYTRKKIADANSDIPWISLIHPSAQIALGAQVGLGTVVMANAVVNPDASIGEHCIINSGATVEHDGRIGNFVHISPNAAIGGTVTVGDCTHIGIGASVRNNITISKNAVVGAGAAVVCDLTKEATYVGVPAKRKF